MQIALIVILTIVAGLGCKDDQGQAADAAMAYVESVEIYDAPFRAYPFLSSRDKAVVDAAAFAADFHESPDFDGGTLVVKSTTCELDECSVEVELTANDQSQKAVRNVVVIRDTDKKWRVSLNLARRQEIEKELAKVDAFMKDGKLVKARETLVPLRAKVFKATGAGDINARLEAFNQKLEQGERNARIADELKEAKSLSGEPLADAISKISESLTPEDTDFLSQRDELRAKLAAEVKAKQLEKLTVTRSKLRRVYRGNVLQYEAIVWFKNTLDQPLASASVSVSFENADGTIVTQADHVLLEPGGRPIAPGEKREFVTTLRPPDGWEKRLIRATPSDFEFAETK